ncbi:MAG: TetR/AcrR family transcriptional regulator [Bacteroidales bacterium]|nr:TetR/AcrR family transcriptional regulator [Bacteroidales bacterium]
MGVENREKIAKGALDLFLAQGIKTVTMDKIAMALSISKRTIYESFSDKEDLVSECLIVFKKQIDDNNKILEKTSDNSFVYLLRMFQSNFARLQNINLNFFIDVKTLFPDHIKKAKLNKPAQISQFQKLIERSQADGYIITHLQADVLANVYYGMLTSMRNDDTYDYSMNSPKEIFKVLCTIYFRGIATTKGLALIDEYVKE